MKNTYEFTKELIQKCEPNFAYKGENLKEWQPKAKEILRGLLGMDKFTLCDSDLKIEFEEKHEDFTEIRFTFQSEEGYRVPCHLLLPIGIKNPPVIVCMQGHSMGMHVSLARPKFPCDKEDIETGDRDYCIRAVKEGFAAVALEMRNFGEVSCNNYNPQCYESAVTNFLMGRTTIGERVWDFARLLDVMEQNFADRVDINNICCMGNSGGGTATAYIAALEDRVKLAMPSCAMCTYKDSIGAMNHCACNYVPYIATYFDMGDLMAMAYPKYFIQVNGKDDDIFPIDAAKKVFADGKKAYEEMGDGERCAHIIGHEGHRFYADPAWPIVHKMLGK